MMISMNANNNKKARPGVALLVVLFVVMAITILSLGFVSRSDVELNCGQNMILRTEMDYLAESGLEHARGLILNPQDVSADYWTGDTGLQLVSGSSDYYDVTVNRDANDLCNYIIECISYRRAPDGNDIGRSRLQAELRLDPCIAYWVGASTTISSATIITGDVYCGGTLTNCSSNIDGDAFATDTISGTITGQKNELVTTAPVAEPNLAVADFEPTYYINSMSYSAQQIVDVNIPALNPLTEVWYTAGDVNMPGGVTINGTLVVNGDLTVSDANNFITAEPNFPALVVTGQVIMKDGSSLVIQGLAQLEQGVSIDAGAASANINVTGGLFIALNGVTSDKITVNITADPAIASIETWSSDGDGTSKRWSPAAGAFYRSIKRP